MAERAGRARTSIGAAFAGAVAAGILVGGVAARAAPPARIVSLNLCTDQILLALVARDRIAAVSHLAADASVSAAADTASGVPTTRGDAEVVLAFDPDLVLAGTYSAPATVALLHRIGRRVVTVPLVSDLTGIRATIRIIAAAVEDQHAGERLIAAFDQRLAALPVPPSQARATALIYQVNGLASGADSLADAVLQAAGFDNHARRLNLGADGSLPLELLVAKPPDVLVFTGPIDEYRTAVADNVRHPAVAAIQHQHRSIILPWRKWLCGTHHTATAIELLASARADVRARATLAAP